MFFVLNENQTFAEKHMHTIIYILFFTLDFNRCCKSLSPSFLHISIQNYFSLNDHFGKLEDENLLKKYAFLFTLRCWSSQPLSTLLVYMIHKIEIYPHYTYPTISNVNESGFNKDRNIKDAIVSMSREEIQMTDFNTINYQKLSTNYSSPYRTVSHYGFNYPSTYMPCISLHPACTITPVDLQRQKVIAFIKRLNAETQIDNFNNNRITSRKMDNCTRIDTGKEENIYEKNVNDILCNEVTAMKTADSFISIAEIQLNAPKKKTSYLSHNSSKNINQVEEQSDQFSSLLSVSGTYPTATLSHIGDAEHDQCTTDSGDNLSNFCIQSSIKNVHEGLHSSYFQKNLLPADFTEEDTNNDEPHKPECEQLSQKSTKNDENKHVTLTLNTLKRKASLLSNKKERPRSKPNDKTHLQSNSFKTPLFDLNSSCDLSTTSTAIEIHINVSIRNIDCVRNLQNHEQEFKSKLEKVINDEINIISQGLMSPHNKAHNENVDTSSYLNPSPTYLSVQESISLYGRDLSCTEADRHSLSNFCDSPTLTPLNSSSAVPSLPQQQINALCYHHTLAMLENELEILLNSIIQNMCDCKSKITQMSEHIRTATLHVGPLNSTTTNRTKEHK